MLTWRDCEMFSDRYTTPYEPNPFDDRPQQNDERTAPMRPITAAEMRLDPTKLARPANSGGTPPATPQRRRPTLIVIIAGALVVALIGVGIVALLNNHHFTQTACATCVATTTAVTTRAATTTTSATATTASKQPTAVITTACADVASFAQAGAATTSSTNFLGVTFLPYTSRKHLVDSESQRLPIAQACQPAPPPSPRQRICKRPLGQDSPRKAANRQRHPPTAQRSAPSPDAGARPTPQRLRQRCNISPEGRSPSPAASPAICCG